MLATHAHKLTVERLHQHDNLRFRYSLFRGLSGLSNEVVERLERAKQTFGRRRILNLTPAALSTLLVHLSSASRVIFHVSRWVPTVERDT
jgi:tRNA U34 5-carboxymethylaminomethyl modifying enzyme MnmG/GidA